VLCSYRPPMVILNMLDHISKANVDRMDGQILAIFKDVFAFEILTSFKCCSMQ